MSCWCSSSVITVGTLDNQQEMRFSRYEENITNEYITINLHFPEKGCLWELFPNLPLLQSQYPTLSYNHHTNLYEKLIYLINLIFWYVCYYLKKSSYIVGEHVICSVDLSLKFQRAWIKKLEYFSYYCNYLRLNISTN